MRNLKKVDLLLKAATISFDEGHLSESDYQSIIEELEQYCKPPDQFWPDISRWIKDLLNLDSPGNHHQKVKLLLNTFMHSMDADDTATREELLLLGEQLQKLFYTLQEFKESDVKNQLNQI